jgi:hypothetical protein
MRAWRWAMLALAALPTTGCFGIGEGPSSLLVAGKWSRLRPASPPLTPEAVIVQYIRVERDASDPAIGEKLWRSGSDQFLPPKLRSDLAKNGLRVARLGEHLDPAMLELVKGGGDKAKGQNFQTKAGEKIKFEMTDVIPEWNFFRFRDDAPVGEKLEKVQGYLSVVPSLKGEREILLSLLPTVEFGETRRFGTPAANLSGLELKVEREHRTLADLKIEVALASGEVLMIGGFAEQTGTLGHAMFTRDADGKAKRSVALLRTIRPSKEDLFQSGFDVNDFFLTPESETGPARSPVRATVQLSQPGALVRAPK